VKHKKYPHPDELNWGENYATGDGHLFMPGVMGLTGLQVAKTGEVKITFIFLNSRIRIKGVWILILPKLC